MSMRRPGRLGMILGGASAAALALGAADCAEPTQIELDIRTDVCAYVKNTGVAVARPEEVDTAPLGIFTPRVAGCEAKPADRIGTLVVYPSGDKGAELAVRIVTGVDRNAQDCKPPYEGCIVARRSIRFVPGSSQKEIVIMRGACVGKDCGLGKECTANAECVALGGVRPPASEGGVDPAPGGPTDASSDAPALQDACAACEGPGTSCSGNLCNVDCSVANCTGTTVCGPGLACTVACSTSGACEHLACRAPDGACKIACSGEDDACQGVSCDAPSCQVSCEGDGRCSGPIWLSGGDAGLTCTGRGSCSSASATCDAGHCALDCNPTNNCPAPRLCAKGAASPDCVGDWQ